MKNRMVDQLHQAAVVILKEPPSVINPVQQINIIQENERKNAAASASETGTNVVGTNVVGTNVVGTNVVGTSASKAASETETGTASASETGTDSKKCIHCYSPESDDSRCCGACYYGCPKKSINDRCECCPNSFCDYWQSGYVQTIDGPLRKEEQCDECECDDCFCTTLCLPFKFPMFFPCFLGALCNGAINKMAGSYRNYLF
jgi:hypothetical protein